MGLPWRLPWALKGQLTDMSNPSAALTKHGFEGSGVFSDLLFLGTDGYRIFVKQLVIPTQNF